MKRILLICTAAILLAAVFVFAISMRTARNARKLVQELGRIDARSVSNRDLQRLAQTFESYLAEPVSSCTPASCVYEFHFDNGLLSKLRLAPWTRMYASIQLADGRFMQTGIALYERTEMPRSINVVQFPASPELTAFQSEIVEHPEKDTFITTKLTSDANGAARAAAFRLNTDCLSRLWACRSLEEMAPDLWRISVRD